MSTTVDSRIVEMRFDNRQFESNVQTSMSTLDKLKRSLKLTESSKGLENLGSAAKKVDLSGLGNGVDAVRAKFSALQVIGVTALANITNSAVNAGKRMVSALTIDPIKSGFQEYETQMGSIQTILANTQKEGTNVERVNAALDELNLYADKTIYNFTEMARNIGTFTAAGVKLDTSVSAIKGIANLAAVSGSTSQQASTAMYQLSQALAAGKVSLMDWNSVVNAGMGGQVFQDALVRTSEHLKTGAKEAINTYGSFRESLTKGEWLTTEVLTETLNQIAGAYSEAELMAQGYSESEAKEIAKLAKTAESAATEVKTFTQLWDTLKEAAQSGWGQTWRMIIGDFEKAKERMTKLSDLFGGIIGKSADRRNNLLEGALTSKWDQLSKKLNEAGIKTEDFQNKVKELAKSHNVDLDAMIEKEGSFEKALIKAFASGKLDKSILSDAIKSFAGKIDGATKSTKAASDQMEKYGEIVNKVIHGDFGSGESRIKALTEAGYDYATIQNLVNEKLGSSVRHMSSLTDEQVKNADSLSKLSDEELKAKGYTEEQITAINDLAKAADKSGSSINELINSFEKPSGSELIWDSIMDVLYSIIKPLNAIGKAWRQTFSMKPEQLYGAIEAVNKFTGALREMATNKDNLKKLTRTFKGLFAILDIIATIAGGGLKIAFKVLGMVLSAFDMNILDVTANIGDAIVKFRDWLFENNALVKGINNLVGKLPGAISKIKEWINAVKETPAFQKLALAVVTFIESIIYAFDKLSSKDISMSELAKHLGSSLAYTLKSLPGIMVQIGKDVIAGFQNGIGDGLSGNIIGKIISFCSEFIQSFASALGCHSPSVLTYEIGNNTIQGFINGVKDAAGGLLDIIKKISDKIMKVFESFIDFITDESGNIEWDKIIAGGLAVSMVMSLKKIADAFSGIASAFEGFGALCEGAQEVMASFSKVLKSKVLDIKAQAILKLAISLGILVVAMIALAQIPAEDLFKAGVALAVLSGVLIGLAFAMDKFGAASVSIGRDGASLDGLKTGLLQIGIALILLAITVKMIGGMDIEQAKQGFIGLAALAVGMIVFLAAMGGISRYTKDVSQIGGMMLKLSIAMMLMVGVIKLVSGLSAGEMIKGAIFAAGFAIFVRSITAVAKSAGNNVSKVGGLILKITFAMGLMVGVVKLISMLSAGEMIKGAIFAAGFAIFVKALVNATKMGRNQQIAQVGGMLISISFSLLLMVGVCKLVGMLSVGEMVKGAAFIAGFMIMLKALIKITTVGDENKTAKVAGTILAMSVAIAILAGVALILSLVDLGGLAKGIVAVGLLSIMMAAMIRALKGAQNVKGAIMMMAIAIGVMTVSIVALSFIEPGKLAGATAALAIVMGMFALIEKSSKNITKSIAPLVVMTVVVGMLAFILYKLTSSMTDVTAAIGTAAALSILMLAMSVSMKIISSMNSNVGKTLLGIIALTAMAIPLLAFVGILKLMTGVENATSNVMALVTLAGALTLMMIPLTIVGAFIGPAAMGIIALTAMAIPLLAFVGILKLMTGVENATANITLLISFMGIMTSLLVKIALVGPLALIGVAALTGLTILMGAIGVMAVAIGALMEKFPSIQKFLDTGLPVLEQLAGSIGTMIGKFVGGIAEGVGDSLVKLGMDIAAFMASLLVASLTASGIKGESFNGVKDLIDVMGEIALMTVGTTISDIFTLGGTSMEKFQTDGVAFFDAMKNISEASTGVTVDEESMIAVIKMAKKLADLQSSLEPIGGVISWFTGQDDLATFGENVGEFITSIKTAFSNLDGVEINEEALSSIIGASKKLANLQSSLEPIGGVISWFTGQDDLATFGTSVSDFISSMKTALETLDGSTLDEDALVSVITAATKLSELQSQLEPMGGVISWFSGRTDLGTFGTNVGLFADAIGKLKTAMGEDGITETAIASITNAGTAVIELQKALPEEGWFDGKTNLTEFSEYISDFSDAMSGFGKTSSEIDFGGISTAITTAYRIKNLITSLVGLDTSGVAAFTGIGTGGFGADGAASDIAKAIADFSDKTADIDVGRVQTSVTAAIKLKSLIASLVGLDTSGIENFKPESIGSTMKSYSDKVKDIDTGVVSKSVTSAIRLKNFIGSLAGLDNSGIVKFKVGKIGDTLKSYSGSISGFNDGAVSKSVSAASRLRGFIASLSGLNTSGVDSFVSAINELGTVSVDKIEKSFSGASSRMLRSGANMIESVTKGMRSKQGSLMTSVTSIVSNVTKAVTSKDPLFKKAGTTFMNSLTSGILSQRSKLTSTVISAVSSAATVIRGYYHSFYSAGQFLGEGVVLGIRSKEQAIYNAGFRAGKKGQQGVKDGEHAASPSKDGIEAGEWLGEGVVIGIESMLKKVYNTGYKMGNTGVRSISSAISKVSDVINSDMDAEPTIRPVLDLSNIESGAGIINGLFSNGLSVGVSSNLNAIGTMMNRNQNGGSDDVVSAINKLRKDLGNVQPVVNNINGVTYDDGSNVSNAVSELIRAIRIEGRV